MVIASLYPVVKNQYALNSIFDWDFIRELQGGSEETPHDYHVFLPHGHQPPDSISVGKDVHIKSTMELTDFFQEFEVDIWHDFGYTPASDLVFLRHLSGQNFPITVKVELPFLADAKLTTYSALSDIDVLICSKPSINKLIETAHSNATRAHTYPQICTIPHGVKSEQINSEQKQDARYLLRLPEEGTIILSSVNFNPNNSVDILPLIRAFQTIANDREDARLIVSGSDDYGSIDRIEKYLEDSVLGDQVLFLPDVDASARLLLLATADIFISPSDPVYTDNGLQVLEAMARGIPVIATDDENGYIDHGKTGFRVEKRCFPFSYQALTDCFAFMPPHVQSVIVSQGIAVDIQQIIEYLILLIEDDSLRKRIGAAALQYVSEHHHVRKIMGEYEELWSNLREESSLSQSQTGMGKNEINDGGWLPLLLSSISQTIDENMPLYITPDGETVLETGDVIIYEEMKDVIFLPIILAILGLAQSGTSLSKVTNLFLEASGPGESKDVVSNIAYHIMWCIKQGLMQPQKIISMGQN